LTCVAPPGWRAHLDRHGNIALRNADLSALSPAAE
jgi:hypothetical protein